MVAFEISHRDADTLKNVVSVLTPTCPHQPDTQMVSTRGCQFRVLSWKVGNKDF